LHPGHTAVRDAGGALRPYIWHMFSTPHLADRTAWSASVVVFLSGVIAALQVGKVGVALPVLQADFDLELAAAGWIGAICCARRSDWLAGRAAGVLLSFLLLRTRVTTGTIPLGSPSP